MKANAVLRRVSRLVKNLPRLLRAGMISSYVAVARPASRRQYSARQPRFVAPEIMDDRWRVQRICNRLADVHVLENRVSQIESYIRKPRPWSMQRRQPR